MERGAHQQIFFSFLSFFHLFKILQKWLEIYLLQNVEPQKMS